VKRFIAVLILSFGFVFSASSQADSVSIKDSARFLFCIKTAPLSVLNLATGSSVLVTVESYPVGNLTVSPEFGFYPGFNAYRSKTVFGIRAAIEIRYYYLQSDQQDQFLALRFNHSRIQFTALDTFVSGQNRSILYYPIEKQNNTISLAWGIRRYGSNGVFFNEFSFGFGIRFVESSAADLSQTTLNTRTFGESILLPATHYVGYKANPEIILRWQIGKAFSENNILKKNDLRNFE
jgi:hypothetical protein